MGDMINEWLVNIISGMCNALLGYFVQFINLINTSDVLGAGFSNLLGTTTNNNTTVYTLATKLHDIGVVPIAHSILALVMLVQIIKISQKMDANATIPALKEILTLAVFFFIFSFLINNSIQLCTSVFNEAQNLTSLLRNWTGFNGTGVANISIASGTITDPGVFITALIFCFLAFICAIIAYLVALVVSYARALQLYVMMAFAPIPIALLGFDETRSSGISFIKSFIAICLSFTILIFILTCFPYVVAGLVSDLASNTVIDLAVNWTAGPVLGLLKLLAICVVLIFAVAKSGGWAKEIMGG